MLLSSKGGYTDRVQQNNLHKDHNAANPSDPIANQGGDSGDIGGVGIKGGLIEGLFDGIEASQQTQHHFFFPDTGDELPFSNEELQQLLRELATGIFEHDALPFFSLHFNSKRNLYPVLNPVYQNTLVGEVIGMLDYLMKGFLNGGYFEKAVIEQQDLSSVELGKQFVDLHSYCLEHKDLLPPDFEYFSLTELLHAMQKRDLEEGQEEEVDPTLLDRSHFTSAFRIIAKQDAVKRADELFYLDGSFEVQYDFNIDALYQEHLTQYRARYQRDPIAYQQLQEAYGLMAKSIEMIMPKLPICAKYFKMLKVISFFSPYFQTLKAHTWC